MSPVVEKIGWQLPEGVAEALPEMAGRLEYLRRCLLDLYQRWGYALVKPPLVEYAENLLTAMGKDLEERTFKVIDPQGGRLLGIRADMTPQVARIDAHHLKHDVPTRLCYSGTVLRTKPEWPGGPRALVQIGAELFGHTGVASDTEIILLMLETLAQVGIDGVHLDVGHVGIFRALVQQAGLDKAQEHQLFDAMQRKAMPEIEARLAQYALAPEIANMLAELPTLNGSQDILAEARKCLAPAGDAVHQALDDMAEIAACLSECQPQYPVHFDMAELRGYHYHTGLVFAAFRAGSGQEIARGGRYDNIGQKYGRAGAATGFSSDLNTLTNLITDQRWPEPSAPIHAPYSKDARLWAAIKALREQGEQVICELPGQAPSYFARAMRLENHQWVVVEQTPQRTGTGT